MDMYEDDPIDPDNPFENSEAAFDQYLVLRDKTAVFRMITDVAKLFIFLTVILGDIFLIVVIVKNPKLKAVKANRIIMHYVILSMSLLLFYPILFIVFDVLHLYRYLGWRFFCVEVQVETTCILGLFLCGFALCFDWLITVNSKTVKPIFKKLNENILYISYTIITIELIIDLSFCLADTIWNMVGFVIFVVFTIIFVLVCDCKKNTADKQKNYPLTVANVVILSWVPMYFVDFSEQFSGSHYMIRFILETIDFIPDILSYGSPLIVIFLLNSINRRFKMAFKRFWKCCKCNSDVDYIIEEESEEEDIGERSNDEQNHPVIL